VTFPDLSTVKPFALTNSLSRSMFTILWFYLVSQLAKQWLSMITSLPDCSYQPVTKWSDELLDFTYSAYQQTFWLTSVCQYCMGDGGILMNNLWHPTQPFTHSESFRVNQKGPHMLTYFKLCPSIQNTQFPPDQCIPYYPHRPTHNICSLHDKIYNTIK